MRLLLLKVNQLGDNVIFLPVVQHLQKKLPQADITVFTSPTAAELYKTTCPDVRVFTYPTAEFNSAWRRPWRLIPILHRIRALRPDACLVADDQGNVAQLLASLSGAKVVVGPWLPYLHANRVLQHRVFVDSDGPAVMPNWHIYGKLLQLLGLSALHDSVPPAPDLTQFGKEAHGCILIHAGASRAYKRWPMERYLELAERLSRTQPVIWITQNCEGEASLPSCVRQITPSSLAEFIRIVAGAQLFIGNNSGPMNLAAALGIPGIIFNGPSRPNWDPFWHREDFDILRDPTLACQPCDLRKGPAQVCQNTEAPMTCMLRWSVDHVVTIALQKLSHPLKQANALPS